MVVDVLPDDAPAPRLCHLIRWEDFDGYGFNLHAERSNPGQFIGKIDDNSPAQMAGLREGDRIVEVNGVNISNENHRQVVERIKSGASETRLFVVDRDTDAWYKEHELVIKSSQMNVVYMKTPVPRPEPDSPRAKFHQQLDSSSPQGPASSTQAFFPSVGSSADDSLSAAASGVLEQKQPMSPDSGRGDEESSSQFVTVEAEINKQSPALSSLTIQQQQVSSDMNSKQEAEQTNKIQHASVQEPEQQHREQPDSLESNSKCSSSMSSPVPLASAGSEIQESTKVSRLALLPFPLGIQLDFAPFESRMLASG